MVQTLYLNNCKKQSEQENHMLLNRPKKGGIDMYKPAWQDLNISEYVYTRIWKPVDFGDETRGLEIRSSCLFWYIHLGNVWNSH